VKLRLRDQGEGWFWRSRKVDVRVVEQVSVPDVGRYFKVVFHASLERQEPGGATPSGLRVVAYDEAWVRSRWQGHEVNTDDEVSVFLWLLKRDEVIGQPPVDEPPSAWVMCRVLA
jgi:hypothetical protein